MVKLSLSELQKVLTRLAINQQLLCDAIENHRHDKEGYSYSPRVFGRSFSAVFKEEIEGLYLP